MDLKYAKINPYLTLKVYMRKPISVLSQSYFNIRFYVQVCSALLGMNCLLQKPPGNVEDLKEMAVEW